MDGYFFLGRSMRVNWAVDYGKKGSQWVEKTIGPKRKPTAQIHLAFVTREINRRVSELDFGAVFSRYRNLVDIAIKKNAINNVRIFPQTQSFFIRIAFRSTMSNQDTLSFTLL